MPKQPTQEMFENLLGHELRNLVNAPEARTGGIWLEDESQRIGQINIPHSLWNNMWQSPIVFIVIPFEERLKHIVQEYGKLEKEKVADAIVRIKRRLGGLEMKMALQSLEAEDIESCFRILLRYYDRSYNKALNNRGQSGTRLTNINCRRVDARTNADKVRSKEFLIK